MSTTPARIVEKPQEIFCHLLQSMPFNRSSLQSILLDFRYSLSDPHSTHPIHIFLSIYAWYQGGGKKNFLFTSHGKQGTSPPKSRYMHIQIHSHSFCFKWMFLQVNPPKLFPGIICPFSEAPSPQLY